MNYELQEYYPNAWPYGKLDADRLHWLQLREEN